MTTREIIESLIESRPNLWEKARKDKDGPEMTDLMGLIFFKAGGMTLDTPSTDKLVSELHEIIKEKLQS